MPCAHFCIPAMTYFAVLFFYDEVRKVFVRRGVERINGRQVQKGWIRRNTMY